jgi:hypothetical protein
MKHGLIWATGVGVVGMTGLSLATGGTAQAPAAPKARYFMDASTVSGFGGNPMAAMMGRGGSETRELTLRLGSTLAPTGAPKADHFMPAVARLGASVPLETPRAQPAGRAEEGLPQNFQRPKGRLLIYWGCGAKAGPGQPAIIDFSKLAAGQVPPNLFTTTVPAERGPTPTSSRTYGEWPNDQGKKRLERNASLLGEHRVAGTYSPEMRFTLARDFIPALNARSTPAADGSVQLAWNGVTDATGYYAWVMGGKNMGQDSADMVWWTSSSRREFGGGLWDWLSPAVVGRLVQQGVVLAPTQTTCTVPAEVKAAAGEMMMGFMYAYGPEQDFAYPPRPADPRAAWRPEWTAKARFRSTTTLMIGMPGMDGMNADDGDQAAAGEPAPKKKKCKPSLGGMLGGMLGGKSC